MDTPQTNDPSKQRLEEQRHQTEEQQNAEAMEEAQIHPPPEASGEDF